MSWRKITLLRNRLEIRSIHSQKGGEEIRQFQKPQLPIHTRTLRLLKGQNSKIKSKRAQSPEDPGSSSVVKNPPSRVPLTVKVPHIQLSLKPGRSCLMQREQAAYTHSQSHLVTRPRAYCSQKGTYCLQLSQLQQKLFLLAQIFVIQSHQRSHARRGRSLFNSSASSHIRLFPFLHATGQHCHRAVHLMAVMWQVDLETAVDACSIFSPAQSQAYRQQQLSVLPAIFPSPVISERNQLA